MSEHQKYAVKLYEDIAAAREKFREESFKFIEMELKASSNKLELKQSLDMSTEIYTELAIIKDFDNKDQIVVQGYTRSKTAFSKPLSVCTDVEIVELIKRM